jgi:hypothetical protein
MVQSLRSRLTSRKDEIVAYTGKHGLFSAMSYFGIRSELPKFRDLLIEWTSDPKFGLKPDLNFTPKVVAQNGEQISVESLIAQVSQTIPQENEIGGEATDAVRIWSDPGSLEGGQKRLFLQNHRAEVIEYHKKFGREATKSHYHLKDYTLDTFLSSEREPFKTSFTIADKALASSP